MQRLSLSKSGVALLFSKGTAFGSSDCKPSAAVQSVVDVGLRKLAGDDQLIWATYG